MQSGHVDMKARFAGLEKLFAEDLGKIDSLCSAKDTTHENLLAGKSFVQPKQDRVTFADEKIAEDLENLNILEDSKYLDVKNYM